MTKRFILSLAAVSACWLGSLVLLTAQNALRFTGLQPLTNKEMALTLVVSNGFTHRIETSTNLSAWSALVTLRNVTSPIQHIDSAAPYLPRRFYRAQQFNSTNAFTGDHLATTNGDALIHPIGHATFVMRWQGKTIYTDPTSGAGPYAALPRADLVLVTHSHGDHFSSSTIEAVRGSNGVIIAPQAVYNSLTPALRAFTIVLTNGASTNVMGLSVEAVPAYNNNHPRGAGNGYVLTIGGKRLYIAGDTGDIAEMRALPNIDVAFVCMNVPFTMPVSNAASAVRAFRPKVVYPYHYRNADNTLADLNDFKRRVGQDLGIEVRLRKWY